MIIEEGVAPWELQGYAVADNRAAPRGKDDCEEQLRKCQEQLAELQRQLDQLQRGAPEGKNRSPVQNSRTGEDDVPQAPQPDAARGQFSFPEVPAAYASESMGVPEPRRLPIREPQRPTGRITGLR